MTIAPDNRSDEQYQLDCRVLDAIDASDLTALAAAIDAGGSVSSPSWDNDHQRTTTPLRLAHELAGDGLSSAFLVLLAERGAPMGDATAHLVFEDALQMGEASVVRAMARAGYDLGAFPGLLHRAGNLETARTLCEDLGVSIYSRLTNGDTPLHSAIRHEMLPLAGYLLRKGADVNAKNNVLEAPLHAAARSKNACLIGLLIEKGAGVSQPDKRGLTPLHVVDDYQVAMQLLSAGADAFAECTKGRTPSQMGHEKTRSAIEERAMGHALAGARAKLGAQTEGRKRL